MLCHGINMPTPESPRSRESTAFGRGRQRTSKPARPESFRVIIADDDKGLRSGLKRILEDDGLEVVGSAGTGRQAVEMTVSLQPDVIVLNIRMPAMDGLAALSAIQSAEPRTKVLIYTGYSTPEYLAEAITNGAAGYLVKDRSPVHLPDAVRAVALGETIVDRDLLQTILTTVREKSPIRLPDNYTDSSDLKRLIHEYKKTVRPRDS